MKKFLTGTAGLAGIALGFFVIWNGVIPFIYSVITLSFLR